MRTPHALLRFIAKALLNAVAGGIAGEVFDFMLEVLPDMARDVHDWWGVGRDEGERRAELEDLAQASHGDLRPCVARIVEEVAIGRPAAVKQGLTGYLLQVPATVRRSLRRPADPVGLTVPPTLRLRHAEDLLPFLPSRLPHFRPGNHPMPGAPRELVELLGAGAFG